MLASCCPPPLLIALKERNCEIVEILLEAGVRIPEYIHNYWVGFDYSLLDTKDNRTDKSPMNDLVAVSKWCDRPTVQAMLKYGAPVSTSMIVFIEAALQHKLQSSNAAISQDRLFSYYLLSAFHDFRAHEAPNSIKLLQDWIESNSSRKAVITGMMADIASTRNERSSDKTDAAT